MIQTQADLSPTHATMTLDRVLPASMPDKLNIVRVHTSCLARKLYPHE